MPWQMFQLFFSEAEGLHPGPKFRLLEDAVNHAHAHCAGRSFAIRTPEGRWHRDASGRAIFGRGGSGSFRVPETEELSGVPSPIDEDEDTQPFGTGSGTHLTVKPNKRLVHGTGPLMPTDDGDETNPDWPPK